MLSALASPACTLRPSFAQRLVTRRSAALLPAGRRGPVRVAAAQRDDKSKDPGYLADPGTAAFTRRREHFVGRIASLGFGFSLIGELLTGVGPVTQLHNETGLSTGLIYLLLVGAVGIGLFGGLRPGSPTFDRANQEDVNKRASTPIDTYIGRLAMAGFAGACALEYMWRGEAPLAHVGIITPGAPLTQTPWFVALTILLFLATGFGVLRAGSDAGRNSKNY